LIILPSRFRGINEDINYSFSFDKFSYSGLKLGCSLMHVMGLVLIIITGIRISDPSNVTIIVLLEKNLVPTSKQFNYRKKEPRGELGVKQINNFPCSSSAKEKSKKTIHSYCSIGCIVLQCGETRPYRRRRYSYSDSIGTTLLGYYSYRNAIGTLKIYRKNHFL
jgi:hypothetical protein